MVYLWICYNGGKMQCLHEFDEVEGEKLKREREQSVGKYL